MVLHKVYIRFFNAENKHHNVSDALQCTCYVEWKIVTEGIIKPTVIYLRDGMDVSKVNFTEYMEY
jgi:hypothetical protein